MGDKNTAEVKTEERRCTGSALNDLLSELSLEIECHEDSIKDIKENTLKPIEVALAKAKQSHAEAICFCKVGDKIQKNDEAPVLVSKISSSYKGFELRVFKLKNDGTPYKNDSPLWEWRHDWSEYKVL